MSKWEGIMIKILKMDWVAYCESTRMCSEIVGKEIKHSICFGRVKVLVYIIYWIVKTSGIIVLYYSHPVHWLSIPTQTRLSKCQDTAERIYWQCSPQHFISGLELDLIYDFKLTIQDLFTYFKAISEGSI